MRRALALTGGPCDDVQCADRPTPTARTRAAACCLHEGDIRLLSGLEEVVAAMRRGADELERWGRCADMDRIEKVRRLGVLVGRLNQQLGAELIAAVAALADIEASRSDRRVHQGVVGAVNAT